MAVTFKVISENTGGGLFSLAVFRDDEEIDIAEVEQFGGAFTIRLESAPDEILASKANLSNAEDVIREFHRKKN